MAYSAEFREAVAYSLRCIHLESLILKTNQEEALFHLYNGPDVFAWFPTKVNLLPTLPFMFDSSEATGTSATLLSLCATGQLRAARRPGVFKLMRPLTHAKHHIF